jgi:CubicO group peptidase (beta-lactamase class C family)
MKFSKLLIFCFLFISSLLFSINRSPLLTQDQAVSEPVNFKLTQLLDSIKNLQKQGFLDGEVLIAHDNQVLLHTRSQDIDIFDDPKFMIGSVSKQFFAVALLKALYDSSSGGTEEAKINDVQTKLNEPISLFLPDNSPIWSDSMPIWAHNVSLQHLLTHTSGIPNYTESDEFSAEISPNKKFSEFPHISRELIELISKQNLLFRPGAKFSYSNTNYVIIADAIEAITMKTASNYMQEALFAPIGLSSTTSVNEGSWNQLKLDSLYASLVSQWKYDPTGDIKDIYPLNHSEDMSVAKGAGSIVSTALDLFKWNQALHKMRSILPDQLYDLFITEPLDEQENKIEYGFGIGIENCEFGKFLGHNGGIGAYRTFLGYLPDYDLSIIFLSHISYDYEKVEGEFKELQSSLKEKFPDESERTHEALKIIAEKYPGQRGFEKVMEMIQEMVR